MCESIISMKYRAKKEIPQNHLTNFIPLRGILYVCVHTREQVVIVLQCVSAGVHERVRACTFHCTVIGMH